HAASFGATGRGKDAGTPRHTILQFTEGEGTNRPRNRTVVDQCRLVTATTSNVSIDRVIAGIDLPAGEPPVEGLCRFVQHLVPLLVPVDLLGRLGPEAVGIFDRTRVGSVV